MDAEAIREALGLSGRDIREYSPQTLAFLGDSVYELAVRTMLVQEGQRPLKALNKSKVVYVSAEAQVRVAAAIEEVLTPEEADVMRRGRGAKVSISARHATAGQYHVATGLETLCGYLYLTGRSERLLELLRLGFDGILR